MKSLFATLMCLIVSQSVSAKKPDGGDTWVGNLNFGMYTRKVAEEKFNLTSYDLTVGYAKPRGFYMGGIYGSGSGSVSFSHMGVSIGYILEGWDLKAHYLMAGT